MEANENKVTRKGSTPIKVYCLPDERAAIEANAQAAVKLPLEMGVLSFVQNVDKELRNGGKASTCGIHAGI